LPIIRAFLQPALFEAFGLTILEAMISGLPTLQHSLVVHWKLFRISSMGINPTLLEETAEKFWILSLSVSNLTIGMKFAGH